MKQYSSLTGHMIYNSFLSGYSNLLKKRKYLNDINLFPVPDGDTGNNMVNTFFSALQIENIDISAGKTLEYMADSVFSGAKGNSGIIIAQFINSLSAECRNYNKINTHDFASALKSASLNTCIAIEEPREGTIITIIRVWADEMFRLSRIINDFKEIVIRSRTAVSEALEKTMEQLPVLKKAGVVDAGASGFVSFLDGIAGMAETGIIPEAGSVLREKTGTDHENNHNYENIFSDGFIEYRYCSEALITDKKIKDDEIRGTIKNCGNSLIITSGSNKSKIHIHTNNPALLFGKIEKWGKIIQSKVDDMLLEYSTSHTPVSDTAIVTDSIADIPGEFIDKYQIHVIHQNIIWNENLHIDRLTIDNKKLYSSLSKAREYPTTSLPAPGKIEAVFKNLLSKYKSLIAVSVSSKLSGTWQVMENCAKKLKEEGYRIDVVNSRLNSAAQGLVVIEAAKDASKEVSHENIIERTLKRIEKGRIYVSVPTLKFMVKGGRVSPLKGMAASLFNLKPLVSLDPEGKSVKSGIYFSQRGAISGIKKLIRDNKGNIETYAVVHSDAPEKGEYLAQRLYEESGIKALYIMEVSSSIGIHTGRGAVAAGILLK